MSACKNKVLAYITHGDRLLVFRHTGAPRAGIQVPAGTVEAGEDPDNAVLREAIEETGLNNLNVVSLLGEQERDMAEYGRDEIHYRRFYHLHCTGDPPSTWRHDELHPSEGSTEPVPFDFFWAQLPDDIPALVAGQGAMLPRLLEQMRKEIVRTGYNAVAESYLAARRAHPLQVSLLEAFAGRLPTGARVLDAGCGAGDPVALALSERFTVTGVDISEQQVRLARQIVPRATFLCQDVTALDFPDESFDGICWLYAVIHVPRAEHRLLLRRFHRLLKPSGLLLLCMGATDWPGAVEEFYGAPKYWSHFDAETSRRMTEEVGFDIVRSEMVPDTLDPETDPTHMFLLAEKHEASLCCPMYGGSRHSARLLRFRGTGDVPGRDARGEARAISLGQVTTDQEVHSWRMMYPEARGPEAYMKYLWREADYETGARIVRADLQLHGIPIVEAHRLPNHELYWESGYPLLR